MVTVRQMLAQLNIGAATNDLRSLKAYLDSDACSIRDNATVEYTYNASPLIYRQDADGTVHKLNPDTTFTDLAGQNASVSSLLTSVSSPHCVRRNRPRPLALLSGAVRRKRPAAGRKSTTSWCWC